MRSQLQTLRASRAGASLLELTVVIAILVVAVSIFSQIVTTTAQVRAVSRERTLAAEGARQMLEQMRNEELRDVFDMFNASPEDDPDGEGTAPGHRFEIKGLLPVDGAPDEFVGEIVMPAIYEELDSEMLDGGGGIGEIGEGGEGGEESALAFAMEGIWMLREDAVVEEIGMPRDLNGDQLIDTKDHRYDAIVLPVMVRVQWKGRYGERSLELATLLTDFDLGQTR